MSTQDSRTRITGVASQAYRLHSHRLTAAGVNSAEAMAELGAERSVY